MARGQTDTGWYDLKLADAGINKMDLARRLDMFPGALTLAIQGKRKFTIEELVGIGRVFGESLDETAQRMGYDTPQFGHKLAISGVVGAEGIVTHPKINDRVDSPAGSKRLEVLRYETLGTELHQLDRWLLYYAPTNALSPRLAGSLCITRTVGSDIKSVRVVVPGSRESRWDLMGWGHEDKDTNVKLETASPVVWVKPR